MTFLDKLPQQSNAPTDVTAGATPNGAPPVEVFSESDYVTKKYAEIRNAWQNKNFVAALQHIAEVERFKLNRVAEKEAKEGKSVKILGRGLEYTVYDIGNNRIQKRHNSAEEQNDLLCSWVIDDREKREKIIETLNALTQVSMGIVRTLLGKKELQREPLGNLIFENGSNDYAQDKAIPLLEYIKDHSLAENKQAIEKYISLTHTFWRSGVCDATFKFLENNGITENSDVIQLDIGEFAFTKDIVLSLIQDQAWLRQNYRFLPEGELKEYIKRRFEEEFTPKKLEELWPSEETENDMLSDELKLWHRHYVAYSEHWKDN